MLRHYLSSAYRNFTRNRNSFFINLIGLTTGLCCALLIYMWVNDELQVDKFHDQKVYQVMGLQDYSGTIMTTRSTPGILAETLEEEVPEVTYATTLTWTSPRVLTVDGEKNFKGDGWHVGSSFFQVFNYPLLAGTPAQVLHDKRAVVLSRSLAAKLFGSVDAAMGKTLEVQHEKTYLVSGVFQDVPPNSSYQFDFVMSFEDYKEENDWVLEWGNNGPGTVVRLIDGADHEIVTSKIHDFIKQRNEESNVTLFLTSFGDLYLFGSYENGIQSGGRIEYVRLFSIIAVFILLIACINFMNLSTARATKRAREVGIRKAIGASQSTLFKQYIGESTVLSLFSLLCALILVWLFIPTFNEITGKEITFGLRPHILVTSLIIALFTGLVAGSYPAIYLARFQPAEVLKGDIRTRLGELWARKGLVIFQFTLSIILIVSVLTVYKQIEFVQTTHLGYNKDNLVYFYQEGRVNEDLDVFLTEVRNLPGVLGASSIGHNLLSRQNNTYGLSWPGKASDTRILFENMRVNHGMLELLGVEMKEGRTFQKEFPADTGRIIFNEAAIDAMGLKSPIIGQNIKLWDRYDMEIIGVVRNFHFQSLHKKVEPQFFRLTPNTTWVVMIKIEPTRVTETLEGLQAFYEDFNPGFTFDYFFMDQEYAELYAAEQRVAMLSRYFAGLAIVISCLGLLGLATFTAERKVKEIGIRKVLGASMSNIVGLLTKDFSKLVIVSIFLSLPIAYYFLQLWLEDFAYRIELSIWYFVGAGLIALLVAWITVSTQALKAARTNPSESLRSE